MADLDWNLFLLELKIYKQFIAQFIQKQFHIRNLVAVNMIYTLHGSRRVLYVAIVFLLLVSPRSVAHLR